MFLVKVGASMLTCLFGMAVHVDRLLIQNGEQVQGYVQPSNALICRYCKPGLEFRSMHTQECEACTHLSEVQCPTGSTVNACSWDRDAHCVSKMQIVGMSFCNNKFVDFGEQCDATAKHSNTAACCTDSTCMLLEGYYIEPACSTICGDGIVAGLEQCDNISDQACDMSTCLIR